ncbi:helix-turn-helix domain-containing protein [Actinoplanes sp. CA-142083]|uniref:helix-turn-helix domain-containing protein n=1 Tax=Actinoplanes sp. CA-142083 TaxID=3239903 RepID=UPI003D8F12AF
MTMTPKPNVALRNAREGMHLSLDEFAERIRLAGERAGVPNTASKRHVQRWEAGAVTMPQPHYIRALEAVTGLPITSLGFPAGADAMVVEDGRGGHDLEVRASRLPAASGPGRAHGDHTGVWLSTYEYFSSGRDGSFKNAHYVVLLQHDDRATVRSLNGPEKSLLTMELQVEGSVVTGTWAEETERGGYYRGARYFGAIQMLAEPTGRRLTGKWVGFGKEMDLNTGPWTLTFVDSSTSKDALDKYREAPEV